MNTHTSILRHWLSDYAFNIQIYIRVPPFVLLFGGVCVCMLLMLFLSPSPGRCGDGRRAHPRSGRPGQLRHGHPRGEAGPVHGLRGGRTPAVSACTPGCWHWQPGTVAPWVPAPVPGLRPWIPAQISNFCDSGLFWHQPTKPFGILRGGLIK